MRPEGGVPWQLSCEAGGGRGNGCLDARRLAGLLSAVLLLAVGACGGAGPPPSPDVPEGAHVFPGLRLRALAGTASSLWSVGESAGGAPAVKHRTVAGWQDESARLPTVSGLRLFGLAADGDAVWAAGQGTVAGTPAAVPVIVGRDPAGTWRQVDLPAGEGYLTAVAAVGGQVWAVGEQSGRGLVIHGSGDVWTSAVLTSSDSEFQSVQLSAVSIAAPGEVWAVGSASDGTGEVRPLIAHLSGGRWQVNVIRSMAPAWGELTTVLALSPTEVWVGGRDEGTPDAVHVWPLLGHWTGRAWRWDASLDHDSWTLSALVGTATAGLWGLGGSGRCSDPDGSCSLVLIRRVGGDWVAERAVGPGVPVAAVAGPAGGRPVVLGRAVTPADEPQVSFVVG